MTESWLNKFYSFLHNITHRNIMEQKQDSIARQLAKYCSEMFMHAECAEKNGNAQEAMLNCMTTKSAKIRINYQGREKRKRCVGRQK